MKYFIDTNLIIDVFERKMSDSSNKLSLILADSETEIFYNGLVYLETLRAVTDENVFATLKSAFDLFTWIDINQSIYLESKKFSRYCRLNNKGKVTKGRCEAIDFVHFVTAKHYQLEILSRDQDINDKLVNAWNEYLQTK